MFFRICSFFAPGIFLLGLPHTLTRRSEKPIKAEVRFLADSTSVRSSYGGNEDVYLVTLTFAQGGSKTVLARLIDRYPPSGIPISPGVLVSEEPTGIQVHRDHRCDIAYRDMVLRTRPGDILAILPEKLGFQPDLPREVRPSEVLPCYRVVRK